MNPNHEPRGHLAKIKVTKKNDEVFMKNKIKFVNKLC